MAPLLRTSVLLVEEDEAPRSALARRLRDGGCDVEEASGLSDTLLRPSLLPDVVVLGPGGSDVPLPPVLSRIRVWAPEAEVIVIAREPTLPSALEALRAGVFDYLEPTEALEVLGARVEAAAGRARERRETARKNEALEREYEARLRVAMEELQSTQKAGQLGLWTSPLDGSERADFTQEAYRILGVAPGSPVSFHTFLERVHPEDRSKLAAAREEVLARGSAQFDHRIVRPDGEVRWVREEAKLEYDEERRPIRLVGTVQDITDRIHAERTLDRFFRLSNDLLVVATVKGVLQRVNPAFVAALGHSEAELTTRPFLEWVHPDDIESTRKAMAELSEGKPVVGFENRYRRKDGSYRLFSWNSVVDVDTGLIYAAVRDITEQREMEGRLALSERMASIGSLAAGIAHEINNPLAYVMSNLQFALDELKGPAQVAVKEPSEVREALEEALKGTIRVRDVVKELKSFTRPADSGDSTVDLQRLVEGALSMAGNEIRHRARVVRQFKPVPPVKGAESRLGQVILNLLVNAAQAIPEGQAERHRIGVRLDVNSEGRVEIEVSDTGSGIAPHVLPRIFDPFFTTKAIGQGTGLGLSICHNIIHSLGGCLRVESKVGEGTRFTVSLPVAEDAPSLEAPAILTTGPASQRRGRILVVDDDVMVGKAVERALEPWHEVVVFNDSPSALARLTVGEAVDGIFLDLMMPVMSGVEFFENLRRVRPELEERVVFLTGGAFTASAQDFLETNRNLRLEKPFAIEGLLAAASSLVR